MVSPATSISHEHQLRAYQGTTYYAQKLLRAHQLQETITSVSPNKDKSPGNSILGGRSSGWVGDLHQPLHKAALMSNAGTDHTLTQSGLSAHGAERPND